MSAPLAEKIGPPLTAEFLNVQMIRLVANFGHPRGRSQELVEVMSRDWFAALRKYGQITVRAAFDAALARSDRWPVLAQIAAYCEVEDGAWRDALADRRSRPSLEIDRPPSPHYRAWRACDELLTREAIAKMAAKVCPNCEGGGCTSCLPDC